MAEGGTLDVNLDTLPNQALWLIKGLPKLQYELKQFILSGGKHVTVLLCGKTVVGKSHLTNALIGRPLAGEGETLDPGTLEVSSYYVADHISDWSLN